MVTVSVALAAPTAVAAVYVFLLFVLPDNCHHVVMFRYYCLYMGPEGTHDRR